MHGLLGVMLVEVGDGCPNLLNPGTDNMSCDAINCIPPVSLCPAWNPPLGRSRYWQEQPHVLLDFKQLFHASQGQRVWHSRNCGKMHSSGIGPNKRGQLTSLILATSHSKGRKLRKPLQRRFDLSFLQQESGQIHETKVALRQTQVHSVAMCPDLTISASEGTTIATRSQRKRLPIVLNKTAWKSLQSPIKIYQPHP